MTIDDAETAHRMSAVAAILHAFAEAMEADLALAPLVIATESPDAACSILRSCASAAHMRILEAGSTAKLEADTFAPTLALVCDPNDDASLSAFGARLLDDASGPVVLCLVVGEDLFERGIASAAKAAGIEAQFVPAARVARSGVVQPAKRVVLSGSLAVSGYRTGERHLELEAFDPYPQTVRFTLVAQDGQEDEELAETIAPLLDPSVETAAVLTLDEGNLVCRTGDLTALRG